MDHFLPSHQNFTQNFARNSKIVILKILVQKWQKICSFQGPKINFGIQWHYRIFWYVSRILKSQPIYRRQKVEVDSTPSAPCHICYMDNSLIIFWFGYFIKENRCQSNQIFFISLPCAQGLFFRGYQFSKTWFFS